MFIFCLITRAPLRGSGDLLIIFIFCRELEETNDKFRFPMLEHRYWTTNQILCAGGMTFGAWTRPNNTTTDGLFGNHLEGTNFTDTISGRVCLN